jgi:hypothetical protein
MKKLNFYSYHEGIAEYRFDHNNSNALEESLSKSFQVKRFEYRGNGEPTYQGVPITHGSILIFEYDDTKDFKVFDFGDNPRLTEDLAKLPTFKGAVVGQYNPHYWNGIVDGSISQKITGGVYPETIWQFGELNYQAVQDYRNSMQLDSRLHWRGSLYNTGVPREYLGVRKCIEMLPNNLTQKQLNMQRSPIQFNQYIQEAINFKLVLSIGGGGGAVCGDFCLRDIEMFGLGVPLIRPTYIVETIDPLIPNVHYIAVDTEFDSTYRYANHEKLSQQIAKRYLEVIENNSMLVEVAANAKKWYTRNLGEGSITKRLIKALNL